MVYQPQFGSQQEGEGHGERRTDPDTGQVEVNRIADALAAPDRAQVLTPVDLPALLRLPIHRLRDGVEDAEGAADYDLDKDSQQGCFKLENNAGCEMQLISNKSSLKGQEVKQVGDSSPIRIKASS